MDENQPSARNRRYKTLTIISAFLFALFWSLGPFFFWIFLGLTSAFAILTILSSGVRISFSPRSGPSQPGNPYGRQSEPVPTTEGAQLAKKVIRFIVLGFGVMLTFLFVAGLLFRNSDQYVESIEEKVTEAIEDPVYSDDSNAWNEKGNTAFSNADYDSTLFHYERALAIEPGNVYAIYNKALVFSNRLDFRKSNRVVRQCLTIDPDYNPGWWLYGYNLDKLNDTDSAILCLERAYHNNFGEADFLELMAEVYLKRNEREKSIDFYKMVIAKDSTKATAYRKLAELDHEHADMYRKKANALESQ